METLPLGDLEVLDAGSGLTNRLLDWYRPRVKHAYLLDFLLEPRVEGNTSIVRADLEVGIPMPDASVDMVTSVSSIEHLSGQGQILFLREAERVLRPGGIAAILEFSTPPNALLASLYAFYSRAILPTVGGMISRSKDAYKYLPESVRKFPGADDLASQMRGAGFSNVRFERMTAGIVALHIGERL